MDFPLSINGLALSFKNINKQSLNLVNNLSIDINNLIATYALEVIYINSSLRRELLKLCI